MKKLLTVLLAIMMCFSLVACGANLTDEQNEVCEEVDKMIGDFANEFDLDFKKEIKVKSDKVIYIATLDVEGGFSDEVATTIANSFMPIIESVLHEQDVYVVMYLNNDGEEEYRIIDSTLPSDIMDWY